MEKELMDQIIEQEKRIVELKAVIAKYKEKEEICHKNVCRYPNGF